MEIREKILRLSQWILAAYATAGIVVELVCGAEVGYILITVSAVGFAVTSKLLPRRKWTS